MKISKGLRSKLNKIAAKYSRWMTPKQIAGFYKEISDLGVYVPAWSKWDDDQGHRYFIDGEEVENSLLVFQFYEDPNSEKNEYNIYFS